MALGAFIPGHCRFVRAQGGELRPLFALVGVSSLWLLLLGVVLWPCLWSVPSPLCSCAEEASPSPLIS